MSGRRERAGVLVAALVMFSSGCTASGAAPSRDLAVPDPPASPTLASSADLVELLRDSWVPVGDHGYFVDRAWSLAESPFSLYETYWQLRWRRSTPEDLQPQRMAAWVAAGSTGGLSSSGLQAVAQIGYSVEIADRFDLPMSRQAVDQALARLSSGALYAPDPGLPGDWGSTLVALRAKATLGTPIGTETTDEASRAFREMPSVLDPGTAVKTALPIVGVLILTGARDGRLAERMAGVVAAAGRSLTAANPSSVDASWLAAMYELRRTSQALGLATAPVGKQHCEALVGPDGYVFLPGSQRPDTQATYLAWQLGCRTSGTPPSYPHTRAGWVRLPELDERNTLKATVSAIRIATATDVASEFSAKVVNTMSDVWMPLLLGGANPSDRLVQHIRLLDIARSLGVGDRVPQLPVSDLEERSVPPLIRLLGTEYLSGPDGTRIAAAVLRALPTPARDREAPIETAALLMLVANASKDSALTLGQRAGAIVDRYRLAPGVFAAVDCPLAAPACARSADFFASVTGNWVDRSGLTPHRVWLAHGLCRGYRCPGGATDDGLSLRSVATAVACGLPGCGAKFPTPI